MADNNRFNAEAVAWDSNPDVHTASALALKAILYANPQIKQRGLVLDGLEIGCGTGLLSFMIAPYLGSLTAVDSAQGMIDAFTIKLNGRPDITNVRPVCALLEDPDDEVLRIHPHHIGKTDGLPPRRFDLIISHLVLHHIPSLPAIFKTMYGCLKSGGYISLTDYEDFGPEARRFHPEAKMQGVERHGIPRLQVKEMLIEARFVDVSVTTAFNMEKYVEASPGAGVIRGEGGTKMRFPFLMCWGRKE